MCRPDSVATMEQTQQSSVVVSSPSSAVHSFLSHLVQSSSVDIVVDNARSGESAFQWNEHRRQVLGRRNSAPGVDACRWSSIPIPPGIKRQSSVGSDSSPSTDKRSRRWSDSGSVDSSPKVRPPYSTNPKISPRKIKRTVTLCCSHEESTFANERSRDYSDIDSDTEISDYFTSDAENARKVESLKDSYLSSALISTIERLSVRAALTLSRPQLNSRTRRQTMEAIQEAMDLFPARGIVTDVPTRRNSDISRCSDISGDFDFDYITEDCSSTQAEMNDVMFAAIDRLSVRAALTLTTPEDVTDPDDAVSNSDDTTGYD